MNAYVIPLAIILIQGLALGFLLHRNRRLQQENERNSPPF